MEIKYVMYLKKIEKYFLQLRKSILKLEKSTKFPTNLTFFEKNRIYCVLIEIFVRHFFTKNVWKLLYGRQEIDILEERRYVEKRSKSLPNQLKISEMV